MIQESELTEESIETLLSTVHLNTAKVYRAVKLRLNRINVTQEWLTDTTVSLYARVAIFNLEAVKSELSRTGLMHVVPGTSATSYGFCTEDDIDIAG